jgi:hypothetical protein
LCILPGVKAYFMKYIAFAVSVFSVVILGSCGENEAGGPRIEAAKPNLPALSTPSTTANSATLPAPGNNPTAPIIASAKLNPAHGQPGHRCDIAVGAALPAEGSAPNLKLPTPAAPVLNTPVQNITTPAVPVVQPAATTTAASGLNPAHGQPGHRCDIAVGQPLNSKPQAKNQATTIPSPVVTAPALDTPLIQPQTNTTAAGLNPAHGQPGHRCDIAVGQPLNSVAKKDSVKK